MWSRHKNVPYRQITRCIVGYQADSIRSALDLAEGDLTTAILMMGITKAWLIQQREQTNPALQVTVAAVARSFRRPHQTLYRHADALVRLGLCDRDGHSIAPTDHPGIAAWLRAIANRATLAIEQLRVSGVPLPAPTGNSSAELPRELAIFALSLNLVGVEYNAPDYNNWSELCITAIVMAHNVAGLTELHAVSRSYGTDVAPADARIPMPLADVAKALRMPYSTMARHVARMVKRGQIDRVGDGLLVSPAWMLEPGVLDRAEEIANYVGRRLLPLQMHGFDFTQPLTHMLQHR